MSFQTSMTLCFLSNTQVYLLVDVQWKWMVIHSLAKSTIKVLHMTCVIYSPGLLKPYAIDLKSLNVSVEFI